MRKTLNTRSMRRKDRFTPDPELIADSVISIIPERTTKPSSRFHVVFQYATGPTAKCFSANSEQNTAKKKYSAFSLNSSSDGFGSAVTDIIVNVFSIMVMFTKDSNRTSATRASALSRHFCMPSEPSISS